MNINSGIGGSYDSAAKIDGVCCEVTNCVYNKGDKTCTAKNIKVGPQFAVSGADTVCSTFKPR